ncbi:formate dehydrogenase subunit delta [Roseomonas sp. SSH11]|uniref:Formate dehydrogenase subunit delta n=2 Tax=Pararoseomonas baculiformis TaxID=2820812 RepID=A0ABS4AJ54_9PROT|nr:formate dehydrogenase subunit delta [Pararoseomonas baculiformis]MBP0446906.1 formate dehydrogenase subunit delta [Pararoseomonas baculiformis]
MANQMADFFRAYPPEEARAGIAEHIRAFWTRRMIEDLHRHLAAGGQGLDPLVIDALKAPIRAESPTEREAEGPAELGQMASDAG